MRVLTLIRTSTSLRMAPPTLSKKTPIPLGQTSESRAPMSSLFVVDRGVEVRLVEEPIACLLAPRRPDDTAVPPVRLTLPPAKSLRSRVYAT